MHPYVHMHTQASELRTEKEIEKKEETIHEISDIFALTTMMPEELRLYKEYRWMRERCVCMYVYV
jgi:hypothetical protein